MSVATGEWDVPARVYHADAVYLSHGSFERFLANPRLYAAGDDSDRDSDDLRFGRLVHTMLLEPHEVENRFYRVPDLGPDGSPWNRSLKSHKAAWGDLLLAGLGKSPIYSSKWDEAFQMSDLAVENPDARQIIEADGRCEAGLRWLDPVTGIPCKSLRDKVLWFGDTRVIVDVKTMPDASPAGFRSWARKWALHRKAAWYVRGEAAVYPGQRVLWYCWAVSKASRESAIYELAVPDLDDGQVQITEGLRSLAACRESGDWSAPWERHGVARVSLFGR